jgi:hypothetical protein
MFDNWVKRFMQEKLAFWKLLSSLISIISPDSNPQLSQNASLCVGPLVHEVHKVIHSREKEGDVHIGEKGDLGVDSTINEQES